MKETISKAQYTLKAKIGFFVFSKLNLMILACAYLFSGSINSFLIGYASAALLAYKFVFSQTKMDNPYKIYLLEILSKFAKNLRSVK